jgi:hypothetical protein
MVYKEKIKELQVIIQRIIKWVGCLVAAIYILHTLKVGFEH